MKGMVGIGEDRMEEGEISTITQLRQDERRESNEEKNTAFKMWCWRRIRRVQWIAKRSNASVLAEINKD